MSYRSPETINAGRVDLYGRRCANGKKCSVQFDGVGDYKLIGSVTGEDGASNNGINYRKRTQRLRSNFPMWVRAKSSATN